LTQSKRFIKWVILAIVGLVIFCIGYSCLQWQLKSYKTFEAMVTLGLLHLKNKKGGIVGASSGNLPVWVGIWPCEKAPRNWGKNLSTRLWLCLCELLSGLVGKLQGTGASLRPECDYVSLYLTLWESQTSRKTIFKVPRWLRVLQM
jgi:hypothetical protein